MRLLVERERPGRDVEPCPLGELSEGLCPRLQPGHASDEAIVRCGIERPADRLLEARRHQLGKTRVVGLADIMAVEAVKLCEIEARGCASDGVDVEPRHRLL